MSDNTMLKNDFHKDMLSIYRDAKTECGYNATRFLQMVAENGGYKTAQKLLATGMPSDGFKVLWECGRLDLTVESLVLSLKYRSLFTELELSTAKERLQSMGYLP